MVPLIHSVVNESKAFFVLTFNPKPEGSIKVSVEPDYLDLVELEIDEAQLNTRNFYSLLTDGSFDSAVNESETFFVLAFNHKPEGSNKVSVELNYHDLVELETDKAEGIVNEIEESFKGVKINYHDKLVSFSSDSASVNRGVKQGMKTIFQREDE